MKTIIFFSTNSIYSEKPVGGAEHSLGLLAKKISQHYKNFRVIFITLKSKRIQLPVLKKIEGVDVFFCPQFQLPLQRIKIIKKINIYLNRFLLLVSCIPFFKKAHLIHTYNEYPDTYYLLKLKKKFGYSYRIVIRMAGLFWHEAAKKQQHLKPKVEFVYNNVDSVNFISKGLFDMFESIRTGNRYDIKIKNSFILDIGVEKTKLKWKPDINDGIYRIMMVGRFDGRSKRHDLMIKAFESWANPSSKLFLIGVGDKLAHWKTYVKRNHFLRNRVHFLGYTGRSEIARLESRVNLFCMPTNYEGLCKSILEAMSGGVPVLASNVKAPNTFIKHNETGFLCENTIIAWKNSIQLIYNKPYEELNVIAENARKFITENYDADLNVEKYIQKFNHLTEQ